jgi:hypothetical protein
MLCLADKSSHSLLGYILHHGSNSIGVVANPID